MNLYVSGCSFTYGHETQENETTIKSHRPTWTWSDHLSKHFEGQFVNEAWVGGSNHRILRRAMTFFNQQTSNDWLAVIQFTDPLSRFEYYDRDYNIYVSMLNDNYVLDDQYYNNVDVPFNAIRDNAFRYFSHRHLLLSKKEIVIEYFQKIITLDAYLTSRNIPHLFTFMSGMSCFPETLMETFMSTDMHGAPKTSADAVLQEHYNVLPRHLFTHIPMSQMVPDSDKENPPNDNHPNKNGHQKIYKYILNELQARNYL